MPGSEHDWKEDPDRPEDDDGEEEVTSPAADAWQEVTSLAPAARLIPVFPLPVVLFPKTSVPLYIFEERYKTMAADVLAADRALAIAFHDDEEAEAGFREICTVGAITRVEELDDGEMNILVTGAYRAKVTEVAERRPYVIAHVTPLVGSSGRDPQLEADAEAVRKLATEWVFLQDENGAQELIQRISLVRQPGALADFLAHHLFGDNALKQEVLESLEEGPRINRVHALISGALERLKQEKQ